MSGDNKYLRILVPVLLMLAGLVQLPAAGAVAAPVAPVASYYVDPVNGVNGELPQGTASDRPWKTVLWASQKIRQAHPGSQAGVELNLRAGVLHPFSVFDQLKGTAEKPFVIRPYGGDTITFDGSEPALREPGAWTAVPGRANEWVSRDFDTAKNDRIALGRMTGTRQLLIAYSELNDLRATNESYVVTPLSDPRDAFGRARDKKGNLTQTKVPFVYMGPGTQFEWLNAEHTRGRVHLRLAPTHFNAPGIQDYPGSTNPATVAVARNSGVAANFGTVENTVVRNAVFQNGGHTTVGVQAEARNVTFDHCQVYGTRFGAQISGQDIHFENCTFDGGLAPWTTRSDVKEEYSYEDVAGCATGKHGFCHNGLGAHSHDILVMSHGDRISYDHCTFRNAHDGLQVQGARVEVAHSLFEDLNDETFQPAGTVADVRFHENVVRGALNPLSFAGNPAPGPIYIYRNVVDQRVPTRGFRVLPPDVDAPWIWRYGADFKNGNKPIPEVHVYQNTFISSHSIDKGSNQTVFFSTAATAPRSYLNNIHLALNLDKPLSNLPDAGSPASAGGNVWYRFQGATSPLFVGPKGPIYFDFASLHADRPDWEVGSLYLDPHLANFTDEYFEYADGQPNTDYRPVADVGGIPLPAGLPDVAAFAGTVHAGALPASAPPLSVGPVDGATVLPAAGVPVANAGNDQTVAVADGDGFAPIALDASASRDPEAGTLSYAWRVKGKLASTAVSPTLQLPEGEHVVRLVVTDSTGKTDSDAVVVRVVEPLPGNNRLANPGFEADSASDWTLPPGASLTSTPIEVHSGAHALKIGQAAVAQQVKQRVAVTPGATYVASGWMRTQRLTPAFSTLKANVIGTDRTILETRTIQSLRGNSPYAYAEQVIVAAKDAAFIELIDTVDAGTGTGSVELDDLRVRDRNAATNGGFESRAPDASDQSSPGWELKAGARVTNDPAVAHAGQRSLDFRVGVQVRIASQTVPHVPGRSYRVSAWVRTDGATKPPIFAIQCITSTGINTGAPLSLPVPLSEGTYRLVQRTLLAADLPANTATLRLTLRFPDDCPMAPNPCPMGPNPGAVHFDDVLLEVLP
jgi:hypothetical protein